MKRRRTGKTKPARGRKAPPARKRNRRSSPAARKRGPGPPAARAPARGPARPRVARRAGGGPLSPLERPLEGPAEGDPQLADPVEAAQEDLRALPEKPLFDRDRSGRDDDLAELLGEEYVRAVTSGEEQGVELRDAPVPEEEGGPFVETSARKEFANDPDDSEPEALPTTHMKTRHLR